jgi:hypothetical protein
VVVYQAYSPAIALPAVKAQRFVPPFSFGRMTWIKPSFLWLMHRSNWGRKSGQEQTLAVRLTRRGWDEALALGVLTSFAGSVFAAHADWHQEFEKALVHVQWDPDRTRRGAPEPCDCIQVGLSRHVIRRFAEEWVVEIRDLSGLVKKVYHQLRQGKAERARRLLPPEKVYPVEPAVGRRLLIGAG